MKQYNNTVNKFRISAILILSLLLTGCGSTSAKNAFAKAREYLQSTDSMCYSVALHTGIPGGEHNLTIDVNASIEYIPEPAQMKLEISESLDGEAYISTVSYLMEEANQYMLYTGLLDMGEQTFWRASKPDNAETFALYNAMANLDLYLSELKSPRAKEEELIDGETTLRYDGTLPADALQKIIRYPGVPSVLEGTGLDSLINWAEFLYTDDFPVSIWLTKDTCIPRQYRIYIPVTVHDSSFEEESSKPEEPDVSSLEITVSLHTFNSLDAISVPREALSSIPENAEETTRMIQKELTDANYRSFFMPANDRGYSYVGRAYCKAPREMFGKEAFLTAYLPYSDNLIYSDDGESLSSSAHGMQVYQSTVFSEDDARAVVEQAFEEFQSTGIELLEAETGEIQYSPEYNIAYQQIAFYEDTKTGKKPRVAILYADCKQDDYYLYAQITYIPEQFDDAYPVMLEELQDAFALTLPAFTQEDFH